MSTGDERVASDAPRGTAAQPEQAAPRVDAVAIGAAACILIGWFVLNTVDTEFAGIRLGFHFYNTWSVLAHPSRLFTGLADGDGVRSVLFGVLCFLVLAVAVAPQIRLDTRPPFAHLAPLLLMLVCGALLYEKTSGEFLAQTNETNAIGAHVIAFANSIAHRLSAAATRHVSLGLGAYVAFAASIVLAVRGFPRARAGARYF